MEKKIVTITNRNSISAITQAEENGKLINIGEYRSLSNIQTFKDFFSSNPNGLSLAFTTLNPGQTLPKHKHPMESMIIVCSGSGIFEGDFEQELHEGDVVFVPTDSLHGFTASHKESLNCISIQNDGSPIYSLLKESRVSFVECKYEDLKLQSRTKEQEFLNICIGLNKLIAESRSIYRTALFNNLKRWSEAFQSILFLRQSNTKSRAILDIFSLHLEEEIGHEKYLQNYNYEYDLEIEAYISWFERQVCIGSDEQKIILTHMVLERAGDIFASTITAAPEDTSAHAYINLHAGLDAGHAEVGEEYVRKYCNENFEDAENYLNSSWNMFIQLFNRILYLTRTKGVGYKSILESGVHEFNN